MGAPEIYPGVWVFIRRHGHAVTVGEVTGRSPRHPSLWSVWVTDGGEPVDVSITERGQRAMRAVAPDWAVHAVDTNGAGS